MVRIIVLAKAVPATIANPQPSPQGDRVSGKVGPLVMNEPDEYALEWALSLKEDFGGEVITLTSGSKSARKILITAFAKGTDRAVHVDHKLADSESHAEVLAKAIAHIGYDLIITGVESSDNMSSLVGVAVAEKLDIPFIYSIREIKLGENPDTLNAVKELGGGITQVVEVGFPSVLCVQACTIPLSLISVMRFLQARNRDTERLTLRQLGLTDLADKPPGLKIVDVFRPPKTRAQMLEGKPDEIARTLMEIINKGE
jgi:electron transfer flavoprotein beta subunit